MSAFGNAIEFMNRLGIFDVVLPFLLVFTLVFAFLEKTKLYGTEEWRSEVDNKHYTVTRRSLNSMTAFVIAFFVVASTQLVAVISEVTSKVVLLIILVFSFMLTAGALSQQDEKGFKLKGGWVLVLEILTFVGIILIFMDALGWLDLIFDYISRVWSSEAVATVIMILVLAGIIAYITRDSKPGPKGEKKES